MAKRFRHAILRFLTDVEVKHWLEIKIFGSLQLGGLKRGNPPLGVPAPGASGALVAACSRI